MAECVKSVRAMGRCTAVLVFVLALTVLGISGCGGGGSSPSGTNNIKSISITPTAVSVNINTQADFTATVTLTDNTVSTSTAVTWQVNGVSGGNSNTGTIVSSATDVNVGIYTAPGVVPTSNNGQVTITAIITQSSTSGSSTSSTTITSNNATVTVGVGTGLLVAPTQATVPAGGSFQFTATKNNVVDTAAQWSVSSTNGGDIGSINATTGLYTAPNAPPPGGQVTITATDNSTGTAVSSTAMATIVFSDASLSGPFAFSYTGDDASGFRAVAGRLVADGAGTIVSGVEDIDSFGTHVTSAVPIQSGSYKVEADGRTSATVITSHGTETWQFVLTSTKHALMIRFDTSTTGSGTIDQQNLDALTNSPGLLNGPYVFLAMGGDTQFNPLGIAGRFSANGAGGVSSSGTAFDQNDNGTVTSSTLSGGSYSFDTAVNAGTGRGVITLGSLQFAFYAVSFDSAGQRVTQMHIIETDQANYLAGDIYAESDASSYAISTFPAATFAFNAGGNSSAGAYASGGVLVSDGNGNITSGVFDSNNAGAATNTSLSASTYTVDAGTGRIDLKLSPSGGSSLEFAAYETTEGTLVTLEIDATAMAGGAAYVQQGTPASLSGNFGLDLAGQGLFHNAPGSYQSDAEGQAALKGSSGGSSVTAGNLDIGTFGAVYPSDPLSTSSTKFGGLDSNGRGTGTLAPTNPQATYSLAYYWVSPNTALLVGLDKTRVLTGIVILQY